MPNNKKPAYEELEQRLAEHEQMLDALRRGEVDAVLAAEQPIVLRSRVLEQKLRESEERFRATFESASIGACLVGLDGRLLKTNRRLAEILGYSEQELSGMTVNSIAHPDDLHISPAFIKDGLSGKSKTAIFEKRYFHKQGHIVYCGVSMALVQDAKGEPQYFVSHIQDISKQKKAENALRKNTAILIEAQSIAKIGSWDYDVAQDKPTWSQQMFQIFDRDPALGEPTWSAHREFIHPNDWESLDQAIRDAIEQGRVYKKEFRIVRSDGSVIWAETIGKAQLDEAGEVIKLNGTVQDISERKHFVQSLEKSEKQYRQLYSSIRDAILVADTNRRIIDCNLSFSAMFGYTLEEVKGQETSTVYASLDEFSRMGMEISTHDKNKSFLMVVNYQTKSGDIFPGETSVHFIHDDQDEVLGFIGIIRDISHRVTKERELRESENRFRTAFESAPEGMALVDVERHFINVNKRVCKILGYSKDELLGKSFNLFTHPDDKQSGRDRWHQIIEKKIDTNQAEKRFIHKNGDVIWCLVSNSAIRDDQEEFQYVLSHIYDITERVKDEKEIIRERDRSQKYLDTAGVILLALDPQGRIEMINRTGCRILRCQIGETIGQDWLTRFVPDDFRQEVSKIHDSIVSGMVETHSYAETPVVTGSGERRLIRWFNTVIKDSEGNISGTLSSGEDITDYKIAQEAINRLASIVESSGEAVIGKDIEGIIVSWNKAAEKIYGYTVGEVLGKHVSMLVPENKQGELINLLEAVSRGKSTRVHETTRLRKDGSLVDVSLSVSPVWDTAGRISGVSSIAHEITDLKRAREEKKQLETQLARAQKMEAVGTLAGGIAHDFNNILAAIIGYTELSLSGESSGQELQSNLNHVLDASQRAKQLIRQILSFSRSSEQKIITIDLGAICKEALKLLRASLPADITLIQNISSDEYRVEADPTQAHQVLMNLCTNAFQAMRDRGGNIEISLKNVSVRPGDENYLTIMDPGDYVCLRVADNGPGIDPSLLPRIFEPYFTTKKPGEGTGLGLSVVHGIVQSHKGAIDVLSSPGQGSEFMVYLPASRNGPTQSQPALSRDMPHGEGHIMFVDDEPLLVEINRRMLMHLGYKVSAFTDSQEAFKAFAKSPESFDLLITDFTMPKMNGLQLVKQIHEIRPNLPVVMCTGYSDRMDPEIAASKKIDEFRFKPVVSADMAHMASRLILARAKTVKPLEGGR